MLIKYCILNTQLLMSSYVLVGSQKIDPWISMAVCKIRFRQTGRQTERKRARERMLSVIKFRHNNVINKCCRRH